MSGPLPRPRSHIRALAVAAVRLLETNPLLNVTGAAATVGVCASSVYAAWRRAHPGRHPRGHGVTPHMRKAAALPFATLCNAMFNHVPARGEASAREIFEAVARDEEAGERRLWRALRRLIDTQRIERVGEIFTSDSMYRRRTTTMNKKIDREQLKRTALAATQDEWQWQDDGDALEGQRDGQIVLYADEDEDSDGPVLIASVADRAHIAAASPPVVLALNARIEELEAALAEAMTGHDERSDEPAAEWERRLRGVLAKNVVLS